MVMEEHNNPPLFHSSSSWKWHHTNNDDHGHGGTSVSLQSQTSNTKQSANVLQGSQFRIKIKGPSPPSNNNNNVQSFSAKSLSRKHDRNVRNRKVENPSCYRCGRTFSSEKSLSGHLMRVNPESARKGHCQTPTSFDYSDTLWGRSPTAKRSRKRDKGLEQQGFEVDSLMQEAAYTLLLMSKGSLGGEVKKLATDHFPLSKKPRIEDKSLAMVGSEKGSFGRSNQIMDQFGSTFSTPEQMQHHANNTTMQVGGIKATAQEDNIIIRHDQGQICNKTSSTGQANRAETHSAKAMEKGQNHFRIFISHYDQPPTLNKGKGIQPEVLISACAIASSNFGL